ncbi:MAG TPA: PfkB family carbohydrate kinase [Arachidicoccus sp.]
MSLTILGTMAFDAIETPFAKTDKTIGGSATYGAFAASNFTHNINQISIVGYDFPQSVLEDLNKLGVKTDGVELVKDKKSFFWSGKYHLDMNSRDTLVTDLNVLADFSPVLPESYQSTEYLFLGNVAPSIQKSVIQQLKKRPKLILLDTMNFWMEIALPELLEVLQMVDVLVVNDSEARQLTNEYSIVKAAKKILQMGPKYLVIKKGEHGALLFYDNEVFVAPALPLEDVFDPTGAGDSFAGGFIGYLAKTDDLSFENMKTAIIMGSVTASFCVEKLGTERLREITKIDIEQRTKQFIELTKFSVY